MTFCKGNMANLGEVFEFCRDANSKMAKPLPMEVAEDEDLDEFEYVQPPYVAASSSGAPANLLGGDEAEH